MTRMDFVRYSISTDDPNLVHIDESVAAAAGLPSVIGSGGIISAMAADVIVAWAGLGSIRRSTTKLLAPLFPGAHIVVSGIIAELRVEDGVDVTVIEMAATADDVPLFEGSFEVTIGATS